MLIRVPVQVYDDYTSGPNFAEVELLAADLDRIRKLAEAVRELDVYKISDFSCLDRFYEENPDADEADGIDAFRECEDFRVDCSLISVMSDHFLWCGYIKHTNILWETDGIPFDKLEGNEVDLCEETFM